MRSDPQYWLAGFADGTVSLTNSPNEASAKWRLTKMNDNLCIYDIDRYGTRLEENSCLTGSSNHGEVVVAPYIVGEYVVDSSQSWKFSDSREKVLEIN
jgi:hypothetical protein